MLYLHYFTKPNECLILICGSFAGNRNRRGNLPLRNVRGSLKPFSLPITCDYRQFENLQKMRFFQGRLFFDTPILRIKDMGFAQTVLFTTTPVPTRATLTLRELKHICDRLPLNELVEATSMVWLPQLIPGNPNIA